MNDIKRVSFKDVKKLLEYVRRLSEYKASDHAEEKLINKLASLFGEQYLAHSYSTILFTEICYELFKKDEFEYPVKFSITKDESQQGCLLFPNFNDVTENILNNLEEYCKYYYVFQSYWLEGTFWTFPNLSHLKLNIDNNIIRDKKKYQIENQRAFDKVNKKVSAFSTQNLSKAPFFAPGEVNLVLNRGFSSVNKIKNIFFDCIKSLNIKYFFYNDLRNLTYLNR